MHDAVVTEHKYILKQPEDDQRVETYRCKIVVIRLTD
jgi:hypothetical protein